MDIRNVGNHGGIERSGDRAQRTQQQRHAADVPSFRDEAQISENSRATANAVEGLAEKARRGDGDRSEIVAAALERLQSGALDDVSVHRATAQRLLDAKFLSV